MKEPHDTDIEKRQELNLCACLGPQGSDPVCPCQMYAKGLTPSNHITEKAQEELTRVLKEIFSKEKK